MYSFFKDLIAENKSGFALYGFIRGVGGGKTEIIEESCIRTTQLQRSALYTAIAGSFGILVAGIVYAIPYNI